MSANVVNQFVELVEAFSGGLLVPLQFIEQLIRELSKSVLMHPYTKGGVHSIAIVRFADHT